MTSYDRCESRAIQIGKFVAATGCTVRHVAGAFSVSKSTAFRDLTVILPKINPPLALNVALVLNYNKQVRHIRGGRETKRLYEEGILRGRKQELPSRTLN